MMMAEKCRQGCWRSGAEGVDRINHLEAVRRGPKEKCFAVKYHDPLILTVPLIALLAFKGCVSESFYDYWGNNKLFHP